LDGRSPAPPRCWSRRPWQWRWRWAATTPRVDRIDLGRGTIPGDVAADARSAYVVERQSGDLIRVDRDSAKIDGRIRVGPNAADIAMDETAGGRVWVANSRHRTVTEIAARRLERVGRPFHVQREPDDLAVLPDEIVVLSSIATDSHALRVSKATHHDISTPVALGDGVTNFAAAGSRLVLTGGIPPVPVVGTTTPDLEGGVREKFTLDQLDGVGREVVADRNVAWVAVWETRYRNKTKENPFGDSYDVGTVIRVNLRTGKLIGKKIEVGLTPSDIAIDGNVVWVASRREGTLTRIDKRSGRLIGKPIALGERVIEGSLAVSDGVAWVSGANDLFRVVP
jgi:DNA-binding beta-propeller fold protein YncE